MKGNSKKLSPPGIKGVFIMKMSKIIKKTEAAKAAANANKNHHNGYKTILDIFRNKIQGAEMLPGDILKIIVDPTVGDEFSEAMHELGRDVLLLHTVRIQRSTTSRGVISVEGIRHDNIDGDWNKTILDLRYRVKLWEKNE